jgi:hypothetical protein
MWSLFTAALARGTSTTQVSIVNTSTNFLATALLGLAVFGEALPATWWAGAALLVAGNVIVGSEPGGGAGGQGPGDATAPRAGAPFGQGGGESEGLLGSGGGGRALLHSAAATDGEDGDEDERGVEDVEDVREESFALAQVASEDDDDDDEDFVRLDSPGGDSS